MQRKVIIVCLLFGVLYCVFTTHSCVLVPAVASALGRQLPVKRACVAWQVNTGAAEVLYSAVGEWAQLDQDSTVLDVCCGTGTIGISLAKVTLLSGK